jgi:pilus assembly protein CpaE
MTIVCEPSVEQAEHLAGQIEGTVLPVTGIETVSQALSANPTETVVVLGAGVEMTQALDLTSWLRQQRPAVGVILLRERLTVDDLSSAMRAGVREVLQSDDAAAIAEACHRSQHVVGIPAHPAAAAASRGKVVTVFSAKGGCGKTTLATNLAVTLAQAGQRVCLVDLDFAFGDVAITLGLTPSRTVLDVLVLGDTLSEDKVATLMTPFRPDLDCLLGPVAPGGAERIPVSATTALLDLLCGMYDQVVIDTPAQITEHVLAALDASHHHVLLTTPEIPALKNLRLVLDMLDLLGYQRNSRTVVLNRSDADVGLTDADIERVVKTPISGRVPSSRDVPVSINRGEPIAATKPQHPVSVAVRDFVATHLHQPAQVTGSRRRGLRLRRRSS